MCDCEQLADVRCSHESLSVWAMPSPQTVPRHVNVPTRESSWPPPALSRTLALVDVTAATALRCVNRQLSRWQWALAIHSLLGTEILHLAYGVFSPLMCYELAFLLINVCQEVHLYNYG